MMVGQITYPYSAVSSSCQGAAVGVSITQILNSLLSEKGTDHNVLLCILDIIKGWTDKDFVYSTMNPESLYLYFGIHFEAAASSGSNAKLLDVYRVTDMRSNEKVKQRRFDLPHAADNYKDETTSGFKEVPCDNRNSFTAALAVLITGASQSRQHGKSESEVPFFMIIPSFHLLDQIDIHLSQV
ncbi:hypothetical protein Tco_0769284 [Tanacetum coccineum]|uniref:Uncharacterized protein n=1 Tax=Tanacetum coccineum TaxID=301880 RepID=A0ABQ4ZCT6_9ASTR